MLNRVKEKFELYPERLIADTAYGTATMLGWLIIEEVAPLRALKTFLVSGFGEGLAWKSCAENIVIRYGCKIDIADVARGFDSEVAHI